MEANKKLQTLCREENVMLAWPLATETKAAAVTSHQWIEKPPQILNTYSVQTQVYNNI